MYGCVSIGILSKALNSSDLLLYSCQRLPNMCYNVLLEHLIKLVSAYIETISVPVIHVFGFHKGITNPMFYAFIIM